eukprot:1933727-Rhodomonas_salina.2
MPVLTWSVLPGLEATGMLPELAKIVEDGQKRRKKEPEQPPMTLFAPTDSAFAQLPEDCLFADCQSASQGEALPSLRLSDDCDLSPHPTPIHSIPLRPILSADPFLASSQLALMRARSSSLTLFAFASQKPALIQELKISLQGLLSTGRWSVSVSQPDALLATKTSENASGRERRGRGRRGDSGEEGKRACHKSTRGQEMGRHVTRWAGVAGAEREEHCAGRGERAQDRAGSAH